MNETPIPVNAKVELLPGRDEIYDLAQAGSRGTVRKLSEDDLGYPLVYIEWDKEHWKYNGEADGWTFASHFRVLEAPSPVQSWSDFLIGQAQARRDQECCPHCGRDDSEEVKKGDDFLETLQKAAQVAAGAEGWLMLTVTPEQDDGLPGVTIYRPKVFTGMMTDDAADMIEAQVVHLATLAHHEMISGRMKKREGK